MQDKSIFTETSPFTLNKCSACIDIDCGVSHPLYCIFLLHFLDFVLASQAGSTDGAPHQKLKHSQAGTKKMVDRKASKGRKIRYNEVTKLVNFTFPLSRPANANSNLDQGDWFRSLFGGAGNSNPNNLSQTK
jgi:hypothetical protein